MARRPACSRTSPRRTWPCQGQRTVARRRGSLSFRARRRRAACCATRPPAGRRYDLVLLDPPYDALPRLLTGLRELLPPITAAGGASCSRRRSAPVLPCSTHPPTSAATAPPSSTCTRHERPRHHPDCSARTHRSVPGHLRPGHVRAPRRHRARCAAVRRGGRRRRALTRSTRMSCSTSTNGSS